ncbi:putative HTH-type transcriptional regulator FruR [Lentibacillus sp. JNUCC-1]|uniref:DeoR/GlpR family DNA-binding transcription regulator n=1 Tax=Lentibacillus sp. JNUCC-1 TaxID=2654513 RepID=UPI0012E8580A|nr:DeoR/GlpR family DNA-binding transcription regulator [Lentibacillus sp. JNUCC-1]MUV36431.1 putative HTH-type transcriptional regulator FruR [Lentibacillus sp. JNUCC-1]
MLESERHQLIIDSLDNKQVVKLQELVDLTNASESTIRRDLTHLENKKHLKRIHGGAARLQGKLQEASMTEKSSKNRHNKQLIASYAVQLVKPGDSIFLDAGSTVYEMIDQLPKDIVVVTNGLMHIQALLEHEIPTYITGGYAKSKTNALIGRGALESLHNYRFDKCFMGVNGIHPDSGLTTPDQEESQVKHLAMSLSREAYVLADESKFSEITFSKIANLDAATIITDQLASETRSLYPDQIHIKAVMS